MRIVWGEQKASGARVAGLAVLFCALVMLLGTAGSAADHPSNAHVWEQADSDVVLRFDPDVETWASFAIPTENARPWGLDVASGTLHTRVWFAETGSDHIGSLVYTSTTAYAYRSYALEPGSEPLNVTLAQDGRVWFTEAGRDRIGRLNPETGEIAEFVLPTAAGRPTDLDLAGDGSVWVTEAQADQIAHLVVTSTVDYDVTEYTAPGLEGGQPHGIVTVGPSVYVAQVANDRVTRFTPPSSWAQIIGFSPGVPDEPIRLVVDGKGDVWGVERAGNRVSYYAGGTFPIVTPYDLAPSGSVPVDIAVGPDDALWVTQWAAGQIARVRPSLIPSEPTEYDYYALPLEGFAPTGIAVDEQGIVWVAARRRMDSYLPLAARDG